ncbi:MAG: FHA domain-containing protein [Gammaproteobacteria bacterium]|nr:FHA domain-containing protein [Gammaproteobacteria bacterium]
MDLAAAGLTEQPFRTHGKPLSTVAYGAYRDAMEMLQKTCDAPHGLSLLQGPTLSGKTILIREFVEDLPKESWVAVIDGSGLNTTGMLEAILTQFGYQVDFNSTGELLATTRVFALQQASTEGPPIVIIENAHALNPSAFRALSELAELSVRYTDEDHKVRYISAIKLILVSDRSLRGIVDSPVMESIGKRLTVDFHLHPMSCEEAREYLYAKLRAAGNNVPEFVFPISVCNELWQASGGWPGILDRVALLALAKAETLPVGISNIERPALPRGTWDAQAIEAAHVDTGTPPEPPTLYITQNGHTIRSLILDKPRLLIGRSEHNDLSIDSRFISRHHTLLVRNGSATFLMDLNSTNGTYVNSRRVSNHVLIDDDIIGIGHHRIKFCDPYAKQRGKLEGDEFADTAIMKTLEDMRALLAKENTTILPVQSEDVPTLGN